MTANERKAELMRRGMKQSVIARRLKVSSATVSMVLSGERTSAKVQREVARLIGRDVADVFPAKAAEKETRRILRKTHDEPLAA